MQAFVAAFLILLLLGTVPNAIAQSGTHVCDFFGTIEEFTTTCTAFTQTPTYTPTETPTATATVTPTATATPTVVPTATYTLTPLPTVTLNSTATSVATATRTLISTAVPTATSVSFGYIVGTGVGEYATIAAAMAAAPVQATVRIRAGMYPVEVVVAKRLTIEPYGDGEVWLDGGCVRAHTVRVSSSSANSAIIRGLHMKRTVESAVLIENTTVRNITLDSNTIVDFDCDNSGPENQAGVAVWYGGSGQRITNNVITRRSTGSLDGGQSNCIWLKSNSANRSGGGHYIAGNTLSGCWDGIGGEVEDDIHGGFDGWGTNPATIIENNTVHHCWDDGIQIEGGTANVITRGNVISFCAIGIANAPNLNGPSTFANNVILDGRPGWAGNVACFKLGDGGNGLATFTNNTCVLQDGATDGFAQTNSGNNRIVSRGNRINVTNYVLEFTSAMAANTSFDEDCLYTSSTTNFAKWSNTRVSFNVLRSLGQELNGETRSTCGLD